MRFRHICTSCSEVSVPALNALSRSAMVADSSGMGAAWVREAAASSNENSKAERFIIACMNPKWRTDSDRRTEDSADGDGIQGGTPTSSNAASTTLHELSLEGWQREIKRSCAGSYP